MNERGQVFTLDMFFALTLTALTVSCSGLAFEQARRQAEAYSLRYSLERTANDAADVLFKTLGEPDNWDDNAETLRTLGLAEENGGLPTPNTVDIKKFAQLRRLTNSDNWDYSANANATTAIKKLFGGSENFEIRILDENDNELWHAFPRWSSSNQSRAENSLEVVSIRRLAAVKYGSAIRGDTGRVAQRAGSETGDNLNFWVGDGELELFDWYIIAIGDRNLSILVNKQNAGIGNRDYFFQQNDVQRIFPTQHGGVYADTLPKGNQLVEGQYNSLSLDTAGPAGWIRVYVVTLPHCSDWRDAATMVQPSPATLEVKMWR